MVQRDSGPALWPRRGTSSASPCTLEEWERPESRLKDTTGSSTPSVFPGSLRGWLVPVFLFVPAILSLT